MYDTWLEAVEQGDLAGVCMADMSAVFDVVDLLLQKLKLYGFDRDAVQRMWSYLAHRSQGFTGSLSMLLPLEAAVLQGSILGPMSYPK